MAFLVKRMLWARIKHGQKLLLAAVWLLLLANLASWVVMPAIGKAFEISSNDFCYSGSISFIDSQGSTCSTGRTYGIGFPFVLHPGPVPENMIAIILDLMPAVILACLIAWLHYGRPAVSLEEKDKMR